MINQPNDKQTEKRSKRVLLYFLIMVLVLSIVITCTLTTLIYIGKKKMLNNSDASIVTPESIVEVEGNDGKTIIYNGKKYQFNENITSILLIGVDKERFDDTAAETFGENGQADVLMLMAIDTSNGNIKAIPISRDTMADVNQYSLNGQYLGITKEQICLSYSYGDGREKSCKNTVTSVSRLLYGMPINSYVAIDIKAIKILNDAVGGVNVTVAEDIELYDKKLKKGDTVNLKGEYALKYIRGRDDTLTANSERMSRQKNYMQAFYRTVLAKTKKDITTPIKLYKKILNYKISNLSVADISYLTQCVIKNGVNELDFTSIPGKNVAGEKYVEYHADSEALYDIVVNTFYQPVAE
ncbi:MAG: LCP family protein [Oscillospiraceae bacterium]|nr:LCP family protein [Oscillospiraceae bacterium]